MADIAEEPNIGVFTSLVDDVDEYAIFVLDPIGAVTSWNAGAERIKGYTRHEIIGRHFSVFFIGDDVSSGKPQQLLADARANGHVVDDGWRVRKGGSRFWANVVITTLVGADGDVRGYLKVTRDDTHRLSALRHLHELNALRERETLAADLNGAVINRIFAAGLTLQGIRRLLDDRRLQERLDVALEELDEAINDLRKILFDYERELPPDS